MALTVAELNTRLTADVRGLEAGLKRAEADIAGFTAKGSAMLKTFTATLAAVGTKELLQFSVQTIQMASQVDTSMRRVNAVFGASSDEVANWAESTTDSFGVSRREALDYSGVIGNMFDQLGFTDAAAADMATSLVEAAAAQAMFNGLNTESVLESMNAAFRQEYDSLQRVIPTISQAAVETKALEQTGKRNADQLTAQEKAAATYALILEGSTTALNEMSGASGSASQKFMQMQAVLDDAQVTIGAGMADAAGFFVGALADIASAVETVIGPIARFLNVGEGFFEDIKDGVGELREVEAALHGVGSEQVDTTRATEAATAAQKDNTKAMKEAADAAEDLRDAQISLKDAQFAVADAQLDASDAQDELNKLLATGGVDAEKVADATEDLVRANGDLADANDAVADAQEGLNRALRDAAEQHLRDVERATEDLRKAQEKLADETQDVADAEAKLAKLKAQRKARDEAVKNAQAQLAAADTVTERIIAQRALSEALGMEIVTDEELAAAQSNLANETTDMKSATDDATKAQQDLTAVQAQNPSTSDRVTDATKRLRDAEDAAAKATQAVTAAQHALTQAQQPAPGFAKQVEAAQRAVERANWDAEKATWAAQKAQRAYNQALNDQPRNITTTVRVDRQEVTTKTQQQVASMASGTTWVPPNFVGPLQSGWARLPRFGPYSREQAQAAQMMGLPVLHQGGIVPGPMGADVPIMAQAGERVIPAGGGMGGNVTITVQGDIIGGSPGEIAARLQEMLLEHQRRSGPLGFREN